MLIIRKMLKTLKRFIKGKFKTLFTIFILSLPVVTLIILVTGKGISGERLYAGYYHYAEEKESCSRKEVYGKIYTIDPSIPGENFIAEWVTVILSYRPLYWVQVGYTKVMIQIITLFITVKSTIITNTGFIL
ncbi:MAG: hypothetical protein DRJ47_02110 [Thermoprotei archaeon]|nr:MAG: hypothetical protein DRJ47_02110 [Thermoprotei archaeon]